MFNAFRTDKNTLVVQEKIMQSSTRPKSGPCTPITQLAQPNLRLVLAGASAVRTVAVLSSCGGNITTNLLGFIRSKPASGLRYARAGDAIVSKKFCLTAGHRVL